MKNDEKEKKEGKKIQVVQRTYKKKKHTYTHTHKLTFKGNITFIISYM